MKLYLSIILFWIRFFIIKIVIEGTFLICSIPLVPVAFLLKHKFGINVPPFKWMLNDTIDGDYGDPNWLNRMGLEPGLWSAFRWWWRNPVWNFKLLFAPKSHAESTIIKVFKHEVGPTPFMWVRQDLRGTNHLYYIIDGTLYGRFSYCNDYINIYLGIGGRRHILKIRRSK